MSGWVKLHRSLLDWEWYNDCNVVYTFIHLLLEANWEDKKWRGMIIPRGSHLTSLSKMAKDLKLSIRQIRTVLDKLQKTNDVTIKTTNGYSLITVVNYDLYQASSEQSTHEATHEATNDRQAKRQANGKNSTHEATNDRQAESVCNKGFEHGQHIDSDTRSDKRPTSKTTSEATTPKEVKEYNNIYNINNSPLPSLLTDDLTPREKGTNPRAEGTNPRAEGTNPRAMGTNPRAEASKEHSEKYAFEGKFVKLNEKDFNRWKKAFPNVELEGFLTSYDAWLKNQPEKVQKEWYMRCSGYLAKKNQENAKNKPAQKSEETIWELYDRMGIPHKKPGFK